MSIRTIEQKITAGNQFDGQLPSAEKVIADDMESYPEDDRGGLFDFENDNPIQVKQIAIKFGNQTSWSLSLIDKDDVEVTVLTGTKESSFLDHSCNPILLEGQKLRLTTVGASTAMRCRISVERVD